MLKLEVSEDADNDRLDIWDYIAQHNEAAAERLLDRVDEAFQLLRKFPELGRMRGEIRPAFGLGR